MTRRRVKTGSFTEFPGPVGKFMTGVTRKKTSDLTCMDDVQLYRVHVYRSLGMP